MPTYKVFNDSITSFILYVQLNITITIYPINMYDAKGITVDTYSSTLQFLPGLLWIYMIGTFSLLFHFYSPHNCCFGSVSSTCCCWNLTRPDSKQVKDKNSDLLVNLVEHLAAKESDISLRCWWKPKQSTGEVNVGPVCWTGEETLLRMNLNVALHLLDG